jgi:hypothetical protein
LNIDAESAPGSSVNQSPKSIALVKKQSVGANPNAAHAAKTRKVPRRPRRSSRVESSAVKLVCRYCGSDDLAPCFKKRRDARCRACFKECYGSRLAG